MGEHNVQISMVDRITDANSDSADTGTKGYVTIRVQNRNGRRRLTTVEGLKKEFSYEKILKDIKKQFYCNGTVVQDRNLGKVIQLQGDHGKDVSDFLVKAGIVKRDQIKLIG